MRRLGLGELRFGHGVPVSEGVSYREPDWDRAKWGEIPKAVAVWLPFAITEGTVLGVSQLTVSSNGCVIGLTGLTRPPDPADARPPAGGIRFGVIWPDGTKLFSEMWIDGLHERPSAPVLRGPGNVVSNSSRQIYMSHWMWPLPPPGTLAMFAEWPERGIPETSVELDAAVIRQAAREVVRIWEDDRPLRPNIIDHN